MINWTNLLANFEDYRDSWAASGSRPFVVIDQFLDDGICERLRDFSALDSQRSTPKERSHKHVYRKGGTRKRSSMTELQIQFFEEVNSEKFCEYIEQITGLGKIYADPDLFGGGLHEILPGGYLNVHTDFNHHPDTKLHRKLNLLLYLNPVWERDWSGQIELWSPALDAPTLSIDPIINRVLIFETSETSFHGHPNPLACPPDTSRRSLAVYYYGDFPEGLSPRKGTNYQLTRAQWAELIGRVSASLTLSDALDTWSPLYQTADIRRAFELLETPVAIRHRSAWLSALKMAGEMMGKHFADEAIVGMLDSEGLSEVGPDALTRLRSVRSAKLATESLIEMPDGTRRLVAPSPE